MDGVLQAHNLQQHLAGEAALRGVSFSLLPGEFAVLLCPEGAGKTALLRILAGFSKPSFGRVHLKGQDITPLPPHRRGLHSLFADTPLLPGRSALQNAAYGLQRQGLPRKERRERALRALALVGLLEAADKKPRHLSPREQVLTALARALAPGPQALLLDDPFARLEAPERRAALQMLAALQEREGIPVLYATPSREEAAAFAHRVLLMLGGRIEQAGAPKEVYLRPASPRAARAMGPVSLLPGVVTARGKGGRLALEVEGLTLPARAPVPAPTMGEDVFLCLRPEQIRLRDTPQGGFFVSGLVKAIRREGDAPLAVVALPTGRELLCAHPGAFDPVPGSRVFLWWDPAQVALVPGEEELFAPGDGGMPLREEAVAWAP
jgi:ABC-type Fe3+/spermidine/putrescine transport system ATPase subunit